MKLILENVKKNFGDKLVLRDASFCFEKGNIYGLLGRNGAGKTTLFNCISGDLATDGGSFYLEENGMRRPLTADDIGYVFSTPILPEFLTGYEFLKFYMDINRSRIDPQLTIDDYFQMVHIDYQDRHRLIKGYSHGMKNKMQMLCFIIARPPVILLDEPLTSFDVVVALEMKQLLRDIHRDHILIFSTHILQLATDLCDDIVILNNGNLEAVDRSVIGSSEFEKTVVNLLQQEEAAAPSAQMP